MTFSDVQRLFESSTVFESIAKRQVSNDPMASGWLLCTLANVIAAQVQVIPLWRRSQMNYQQTLNEDK